MAVLKVVKVGDPVLRQPTQPVTRITKRISRLIQDMFETMYAVDGVGLAAPQVGVSRKIAVIDVGEGPIALINPKIVSGSDEDIDVEGCLSIPGKQAYVKRLAQVKVEALNEKGKPVQIEAEGLLARALQHEIDHLNGILFTDLVDEKDIIEGDE
ncbi:MAG TPA: peptide deformylase [Firmicutes bacterium]|nr:peptide deformylase [Bacillota bacterium]